MHKQIFLYKCICILFFTNAFAFFLLQMHTHTFFCKCIRIFSFTNAYAYFLLQMLMHIFFYKCICIFSFTNAYAYFLLQMHVHIFLSSISPLSYFLRDKGFILAESVDKDQTCSLILLCTFRCCFIKFCLRNPVQSY